MRQFYLFFVFLSLSVLGFGQTKVILDINTKDYASGKKLSNVTIDVFDGANIVQTIVSPSNGNVQVTLLAGKKYKLEFSKSGKVSRNLNIDAKGIEAEMLQGGSSAKAKFDVSLFDQVGTIDYSYVEKYPFTEYYFDGTNSELKYDEVLAQKMAKKIADLIAKGEQEASKVDALYQDAIAKADDWYKKKNWQFALDKYTEASTLKRTEQYPQDKIKELDALIKKQKEEDLKGNQKEEEYKKLIATADALKAQKKYSEAIAKYNEALKIKDEQYAKDQINTLNKLVEDEKKAAANEANYKKAMDEGETFYSQSKYAESKNAFNTALTFKKNDPTALKRIADIEVKLQELAESANKKKNYDAKIAEAEQLLAGNKLLEAKTKFQDAQKLDVSQTYPATKIKEIDAKLADADKNKKITEQYNAAMKIADDLFNANKLTEAKSKYIEAGKIDPSQSKPAANIQKIDNLLAEQEKIKQFNELKSKGISSMTQKKWNEAKQFFTDAKNIKADPEIDVKLKEIEAKIAEENSKLNVDQIYAKTIEEAKSLENSNIDAAIAKYKEAQKLKSNESLPPAKIKELEAKKGQQAEIDSKYKAAIKKGDDLFNQKKYIDAIKAYNEAGAIKPNEKEPVEKAKKAQDAAQDDVSDQDKQYNKILEAGQKAIDDKDWVKAKDYFNRAANSRNTDPFPKKKLKEIDDLIKAEQDSKNNSQADKLYDDYMRNGATAQNSKNYNLALSEYKNALNIKKNDKNALKKIDEVQQLIDAESNNASADDFDKYVSEGDTYFAQEKWIDAKNSYERALKIKNDRNVKKKYDESIRKAQGVNEFKKQYDKVIAKADEYFAAKNYPKAKELYERAISLNNTLNLTDPYPINRLREIDSILNPAVIVPSGPLPPLGIPTTESPEKVNEELIKAELIRKNKKESEVNITRENIQNNTNSNTLKNTEEIYDNSATLSEIEKRNAKRYEAGDENRQNTVDIVEKSKKEINRDEINNNTLKYNESLNTSEQIKNVNKEIDAGYKISEQVYTDNSQKVKTIEQDFSNKTTKDNQIAYSENLESQKTLNATAVKIGEQVQDDYESRKAIDEQVKNVNIAINKNENTNQTKESDNILAIATKLEEESKVRAKKTSEDSKIAGNNGEEIKVIDKEIYKVERAQSEKNTENNYYVDNVISQKQKEMSTIPEIQDGNRQQNVDRVNTNTKEIQDKNREEYNKNVVKHLSNQSNITNTESSANDYANTRIKDQSVIAKELDVIDKKANIANVENTLNDDQQRANTKSDVTNTQDGVSKESIRKAAKVDENISSVQNTSTDIANQKTNASNSQKQELENNQVTLSKIASKEMKYDDKEANSIGATYPEGVSQEVFNQNDENGLLVAVVTRRIVVKNGYGQVYIRTQSLNGITYSKNGEASSEYIWQRETQDSKLKKNY